MFHDALVSFAERRVIFMKKAINLISLVILLCSGCQTTPTSNSIINMQTSDSNYENEAEEIEKEDIVIEALMLEEIIDEKIRAGNINITLNGVLSKPNTTEGLYTYSAYKADYTDYFTNMDFLFEEYEDDMLLRYKNTGEKMVYIPETKFSMQILTFYEGLLLSYTESEIPVSEGERKVNMTEEESIAQAENILERIGVSGFVLDGVEYKEEQLSNNPYGEETAYLGDKIGVHYIQQLQGVPVGTYFPLNGNSTSPRANVWFDSKGVKSVSIIEFLYIKKDRINKCIEYEDALDLFKKHIENNSSYDEAIFDKISFEYVIINTENEGYLTIPCWKFYIQLGSNMQDDIVIDARSGEILKQYY